MLKFENENLNYIFKEKPAIYDLDINYIASIEEFYLENGYIKEGDVSNFLNYFISESRKKVAFPIDPVNFGYRFVCSRIQGILNDVFLKMNFASYGFNVGKMFREDVLLHQLDIVTIPVMVNDEVVNKNYLLDPSFRQFCIDEENRFERYFEEPRYSVKMSTPHPGYFLNMNEDKRVFANELIKNGYFEMTDENIKKYFDAFALYLIPKEDYKDESLIGKIDETSNTADYYKELINKSIEKTMKPRKDDELVRPIELIEDEKESFFDRFRGAFRRR